jgi:serine/threonine protein kinase/tetratricopeptide (TPR) repeat protein
VENEPGRGCTKDTDMGQDLSREEAVFQAALELPEGEERAAYLESACGGDAQLRRRVEALLRHCTEAQGPLDRPPAKLLPTTEQLVDAPGTTIGPYKLLEQVGEGGMGLVFVAEQQHPVRRKVALKVIKPGMDSKQVIARFEAERQALALMDHPNIAQVHDGGTTPGGGPFFVMELVKGVPITAYCDQVRAPIRERLGLFLDICQAVQHAHQKGIIHRDIKPSNVLVAQCDGKPVVKVIDFGIAKAIGQQLTDKTVYTQQSQLVGTPLYMAPEQAGESSLDIDTRSDIYALGVLLYELLTGTTPFDKERFKEAGYEEVRRIIREEEPPKPSTRISTLGQAAGTVSAQRRSDPKRLSQLVRGDLDWVVIKALEKDRNRRYETASALAADVERYLQDKPVLACPPSAWYRLRKFVRRNKVALFTAAVVAVALVLGTVVSAWQAVRAIEANRRLQDNLDLSLQTLDEIYLKVLEARSPGDPEAVRENQELLTKALDFYERFTERNADDAKVWREVAKAYNRAGVLHTHLGHYDQAVVALDRAADVVARLIVDSPADSELKRLLGEMYLLEGRAYLFKGELNIETPHQHKMARVEFQKGIDLLGPSSESSALGPKYRETLARLHHDLGLCVQRDGDLEKAEKHYREAIKVRAHIVEEEADLANKLYYMQELAVSHGNLGHVLNMKGCVDEAEKENRQALELIREVSTRAPALPGYKRGRLSGFVDARPVPHDLAYAHWLLGNVLRMKGRSRAAEEEYRQAVDFLAQVVEDWPGEVLFRTLLTMFRHSYGLLLFEGGKRPEAIQQYQQAIELCRQLQKEPKRELANAERFTESLTLMGDLLFAEGDRKGAATHYREALGLMEKLAQQNAKYEADLAWFLVACADPDFRSPARAVALSKKAVDKSEGKDGNLWNTLGVAQYRLGDWQAALDSLEKANRLRGGREAEDWLWLAMAQWRLGQKEMARDSYKHAVELLKKHEYPPAETSRWRAEAAALLGLKETRQ